MTRGPIPGLSAWWNGGRRRRLVVAAATMLGAALLIAAGLWAFERSERRDDLYVVLPFATPRPDAPLPLTPENCASLLYEALSRWEGVALVDPLRESDLRARRGHGPLTLADALATARELGARLLVWGKVWQHGGGVGVQAALYDVAAGSRPIRQHTVLIAPDLGDLGPKFIELGDVLLLGRARSRSAIAGGIGTASVAAWQAFEEGRSALFAWDLPAAERGFRGAVWLDPDYPDAHLWLAQTMAWAGKPAAEWRSSAAKAFRLRGPLAPRDRILAHGLFSMAGGRFEDACGVYRDLIARDSLDFTAWLGLADCHAGDPVVVRDRGSPSGWSFRGSYHAAVEAYGRALQLVPSSHQAFKGRAFFRLSRRLYAESNLLRRGFAASQDTVWFGAFPGLQDDTLTFVPGPLADVLSGQAPTAPAVAAAAVTRNRERLREIATEWVRTFPRSADAHEALAQALEALGMLGDARSDELSALATVRRARRISHDRLQALRLGVAEARLLLKRREFPAAARLAERVLAEWRTPEPAEAMELAGLAALTGRSHRTAELLVRSARLFNLVAPDGRFVSVPAEPKAAALALLAYAAVGTPAESITALGRRVQQLVEQHVPPAERERARFALLDVPARLAFPDLGLSPVHREQAGGHHLLELQWSLGRGDTVLVRERLDQIQRSRLGAGAPGGDVAMDISYGEARLLLALGDTAGARRLLDGSLAALPILAGSLLWWVPSAAGLVRSMVLRAELADRAGDRRTSREWAESVLALWSRGDAELSPVLRRMREIAVGVGRGNGR